jgi:hypothetical protein
LDKLDELEKLENLKEQGILNEEEFEKEKQKILNQKETMHFKGNKKVSISFFIVSGLLLILTISFIFLSIQCKDEIDEMSLDYLIAKYSYEDYKDEKYKYRTLYEDAKEEYEDLEKEYNKRTKKYNFYNYGKYVTGGLCIASLGVGIIFIERKNKKE